MEGKNLRLALACAYAGNSAALGARLRHYPCIEDAYAERARWWPDETPARQQRLDACCAAAQSLSQPPSQHPWLTQEASHDWQLLALGDDAYPPLLAQLGDAPGVLFVRGDVTLMQRPQLAMK